MLVRSFFTIEELDERIVTFDFLNNKPSQVDSNVCRRDDSEIKQSASQMIVH